MSGHEHAGGTAPGLHGHAADAAASAPERGEGGDTLRAISRTLAVCAAPRYLRRTATIGVVVGTWLTFMNHGDALLYGSPSWELTTRVALNYLTPFVVSNLGLLSRPPSQEPRRPRD